MRVGNRQPTVEWQVCGVCNYDCSYCIQSRSSRTGQPEAGTVEGLLGFFGRLPGRWEIKMSGGEPFAADLFMTHVVPGLVERTVHTVSVLTNLSAPMPVLERFAAATRGRLGIMSASLHLERVRVRDFVDKAVAMRGLIGPGAQFVVNTVLVPSRLPEIEEAGRMVESAGLRFFPQVMKVKTPAGVFPYDEEDRPRVDALTGSADRYGPLRANTAPSYHGRPCWAGVEYFTVTQTGDAWACRSAKREKEGFLGNALDGSVRLRDDPEPCSYRMCPCTVPANRGMIGEE
ncbi:MAG: radical SAM protein [Spirochaetes bacterium]|nr:radical SAM protein [Spirochaetota bacterium]